MPLYWVVLSIPISCHLQLSGLMLYGGPRCLLAIASRTNIGLEVTERSTWAAASFAQRCCCHHTISYLSVVYILPPALPLVPCSSTFSSWQTSMVFSPEGGLKVAYPDYNVTNYPSFNLTSWSQLYVSIPSLFLIAQNNCGRIAFFQDMSSIAPCISNSDHTSFS